jgi:ubiquinone/menaquinone biosynthesis C-methylase UbiE
MTSSGLDNSGLSSLQQDQYSNASKLDARIALHARFSERNDWYDWLFEHYRVPDTGRILELGCGSGQLWRHLGERIPDGWQIMLTDLSPGMIGTARENLAGLRRDFRFQVVDAQAIPFGDATFDAVIANHMLYHVPDRDTAFAEIRRVLRTRGQLYAGTNGAGHLQELSAVLEQLA